MIDEIVDANTNTSNNTNGFPDGTNDIDKEIVNNINTRGGWNGLLPRGYVGIIKKLFNKATTDDKKLVSIILKPITSIIAWQIKNLLAVKNIYKGVKTTKTVVASIIGLASM